MALQETDPDRAEDKKQLSRARLAGRYLKDAMAPARLKNLRDAQKLVEAAANLVMGSATVDILSTAKIMLEASKVTAQLESLSVDRKISELRAELDAFITGQRLAPNADGSLPLALPATAGTTPLGGYTDVDEAVITVPVKRKVGRPRKHPLPVPPPAPFIPTPAAFHAAYDAFLDAPDEPDAAP
jgi:hypothetical protein